VLNRCGVGVRGVSLSCERQRREQLVGVDRVGKGLEQLERCEPTLQQPQPLPIGGEDAQGGRPAPGDLAEQLQARPVLQLLAGHDDIELVLAQQIDAVGLVGHSIDHEVIAQGAHDRLQHR
jgi:hypothetical protein